jgi:hypothetical protein
MTKRPRSVHVKSDNGDIIISTQNHYRRLPDITGWECIDVTSDINPEETLYYLVIQNSLENLHVRCKDEDERNNILTELNQNTY